jgi:nitrite reductase/ring-hydroxylating ferredoxin subunit
MPYYEAAQLDSLPQGEMISARVNKEEILIANINGKIYAINNRCGHMNASLSLGKLNGKIIECPLHKARYDVTTGKCIAVPQMGGLEGIFIATTGAGQVAANIDTLDLKTYRTKIEGSAIKVEITECEASS